MFIFSTLCFGLAADGSHPWWNYPGLELWKFLNVFLLVVLAFLVHRWKGRPIREALRARRESIKRELQRAREERDQALAKLAEIEKRFGQLDAEVATIKERSRVEADAEKERIRVSTEREIIKIRDQARREIESATKAAKHDLRRFAAQESVRLAEEILEREIRPEDDERLTNLNLQELRRTQA